MNTLGTYILDDENNPVPVEGMEWGRWFQDNPDRCRVALNKVYSFDISTMFLGLDHSMIGSEKPLLYETMIFKHGCAVYMERFSTWEEAMEGHLSSVQAVRDNPRDFLTNAQIDRRAWTVLVMKWSLAGAGIAVAAMLAGYMGAMSL